MTPEAPSLTPCRHMRRALECMAQGKRGGLFMLYARVHAIRCPQCRAALAALRDYFARLRTPGAAELDRERLSRLLDSVDKGPSDTDLK